MLREFGVETVLTLQGDSAAAKGTLSREGSGRIKHLEVRQLWLQSWIKSGEVRLLKIPRDSNSSDTLTKHWAPADSLPHFRRVNLRCFDLGSVFKT